MNPRNILIKPPATKAERAERRRNRMKSLVKAGYSRSHAFKLAKEEIK